MNEIDNLEKTKDWDWRDAWCAYRNEKTNWSHMNAFVAGWEAHRSLIKNNDLKDGVIKEDKR